MKIPDRTNVRSREFIMNSRTADSEESGELWVQGRAASYDSPTVLFEINGVEYKEVIERGAFDGCEMSDVIFNYNHSGKVMARTRNKTLQLETSGEGLEISARLDGTEEGRRLHDEIKGGYIDRMSFRFTIREEAYDKDTHTWKIRKIKRLYDVSAVDIPAYEDTSIEARKSAVLEAEAQEQRAKEAETSLARERAALKIKLSM